MRAKSEQLAHLQLIIAAQKEAVMGGLPRRARRGAARERAAAGGICHARCELDRSSSRICSSSSRRRRKPSWAGSRGARAEALLGNELLQEAFATLDAS